MNKHTLYWLVPIVIAASTILWVLRGSSPTGVESDKPFSNGDVSNYPQPVKTFPAAKIAETQATASQSPSSPAESKRAKVEALLKSGNPRDAFEAFKLIQKCFEAKQKFVTGTEDGVNYKPVPNPNTGPERELCGDLTNAEIVSRVRWLETAAKAGVPGAAYAFSLIGPAGYGAIDHINDPEWNSRVREYFHAEAKNGDYYSALSLSTYYENESSSVGDRSRALTYYVLASLLYREKYNKDIERHAEIIQSMSANVPAGEAKHAIDRGEQMYKEFKNGITNE